MEEEFYSSIKLVTGEEVFALISTDEHEDEPIIIMQNPVIMKVVNNLSLIHISEPTRRS